jgi:hypothetical protein
MRLSSQNKTRLALILLLLFRLFTQLALYRAGFISLTADEFGRTIVAAAWSKHPVMVWNGVWLPFHTYLFGTALLIKWELLWMPRLVTILIGCVSIVLMYFLASSLFESQAAGLISAFLLSVNPAHIWLSATPLTEMPNATLVLAATWSFGVYLKNSKRVWLFIAAGALALANGFRFESWLISALFTLIVLSKGFLWVIRRKNQPGETLFLVIAACIPWVFPLGWMIGNYIETQNPFYFTEAIRAYKLQWYGQDVSYRKYVETFLRMDPYLAILGILGILVCLLLNKRSKAIQWYVAATAIPLAVYILLSGGQVEPPGNYIRYLAPFAFLFYPSLGYLLIVVSTKVTQCDRLKLGLVLFLGLAAITQIQAAFRFKNDPAADGLAVGLAIREMREGTPEISDRPVLIELSYWQYLAIHTGANDIDRIVYDRVLDPGSRASQSLLLTDEELFQSCLRLYNVSTIVVKDPRLRSVVESGLQLQPAQEVNGYAFYPIDTGALNDVPADQAPTCPLPFGSGY